MAGFETGLGGEAPLILGLGPEGRIPPFGNL